MPKRIRNKKYWIDNIAKGGVDFGVKHQNRKGVINPERKMKARYKKTCRLKCQKRLIEEQWKIHFSNLGITQGVGFCC